MCIIQISTTSTCSSAPKFVEKSHVCLGWIYRSHARNGNEIQTSGRRGSAGNIEKLGFLNSRKYKTHLKIMKLGMVSFHGANMLWAKNWLNWDKFWYKLLANRSFSREGSWFREGTCHLRVRNDVHTLPSPALIFLHRQIRPNRSIVLNFGIIPGSFGLFIH